MHQLHQRYLQRLAAQRFDEEELGDFTEEELREEAAFRCWLWEVDPQDNLALPSSSILQALANDWD